MSENREDLIKFVQEQLIGPGACGEKFELLESSEQGEVINTTPGSIYCSSILFPKKKESNGENNSSTSSGTDRPVINADVIGQGQENAINSNDNLSENDNEEDTNDDDKFVQLNQRYPQSFGITVCFNLPEIKPSDFEIIVSGRYYKKIQKEDIDKVIVHIDSNDLKNVESIATATPRKGEYSDNMSSYFTVNDGTLKLNTNVYKNFSPIKKCIDTIDQISCEDFAKEEKLSEPIFSKILGIPYLTTYKEKLFSRLKSKTTSSNDVKVITDLISRIEEMERALSYFRDIQQLLDTNDYGFWKAENFNEKVDLSSLDLSLADKNKKILMPSDYDCLNFIKKHFKEEKSSKSSSSDNDEGEIESEDKIASLALCLQLTRDTRSESKDRTYLKIQIQNTSCPFEETGGKYYSIVTDGVNKRCFFGVRVEIRSKHLCSYKVSDNFDGADEESKKLRYIYRNVEDFAIGHLCSANWDINPNLKRVWSEFLPQYDIPDVDTTPQLIKHTNSGHELIPAIQDTNVMQIKWLSTLNSKVNSVEIISCLEKFCDAYKRWIDNELVDSKHSEFSNSIRQECLSDYERMLANLNLLKNEENMQVFRLMNTAMFIQMWHSVESNRISYSNTKWAGDEEFYRKASDDIFNTGSPVAWRPFQLAFILLNLDGIIQRKDDKTWASRNNLVDLVWFPTGGGKTEAYLGIIALTIIYRRIINHAKPNGGSGTTAIMRYTLRLLATQQFQRASRLIFALEEMRKWGTYHLGENEISIGLFVGNDALPNSLDGDNGLKTEINKWLNQKESKVPLNKCPWCGSELSWDESTEAFCCINSNCCFSDKLPVLLCDESIFKYPPTLLFGTVDKFAMIAHKVAKEKNKDSRRLFCSPDGLTPDLIIQDELHLLQGTLGSAVGLFECAIDILCSRDIKLSDGSTVKIRPKVISSTATTRNTSLQIKALYDRAVNIFPKSGINFDDSFFAFYKRKFENGQASFISKRRYVGILPTGRTSMFMQVRLAACCFIHRLIFENKNINDIHNKDVIKVIDYYYSLISYFNSLKEVGTTDVQFYTEFTKYTRRLFRRVLRPTNLLQCYYTYDNSYNKTELTGRLTGPEVVKALDGVQIPWNPDSRLPHLVNGETIPGITPPDFILATNMISVGIDVSRFNLMIVNSMPRNLAEYIQASSRVARNDLGIVFTLHNPFRARDVSHFERFKEFHEKLYYYVEPISITPFSDKAIERYMPLVLATLIRHQFDDLADNKAVKKLDSKKIDCIKEYIEKYFIEKLQKNQEETDEQLRELFTEQSLMKIREFIDNALQEWLDKNPGFYSNMRDALFISSDSYEEEKVSSCWVVPKSVRTVPGSSVIKVNNEI